MCTLFSKRFKLNALIKIQKCSKEVAAKPVHETRCSTLFFLDFPVRESVHHVWELNGR